MKNIWTWCLVGVFSMAIVSCAGKDKGTSTATAEPATYTCSACKEKITWVYGSWPESPKQTTARKVVKHDCPACKKEWSGNLSTTTTCSVCTQEHANCPMCQAHGN